MISCRGGKWLGEVSALSKSTLSWSSRHANQSKIVCTLCERKEICCYCKNCTLNFPLKCICKCFLILSFQKYSVAADLPSQFTIKPFCRINCWFWHPTTCLNAFGSSWELKCTYQICVTQIHFSIIWVIIFLSTLKINVFNSNDNVSQCWNCYLGLYCALTRIFSWHVIVTIFLLL